MTNYRDVDSNNVIPFPGVRRMPSADWATRGATQAAAVVDASLNVRLTILLGLCVTSASLVLAAIHLYS